VNSQLPAATREFYLRAMRRLDEAGLEFLVGGAYAYERYTGIARHTKDFDIFVHPRDVEGVLAALGAAGCETDLPFPHWLGKARCGEDFVDVIFSSGNGVAAVDDDWFRYSVEDEVFGRPVRLIPAEEMIWSKAFIMERERFDGGDVAHILRASAERIDWTRLVSRFGPLRVLTGGMATAAVGLLLFSTVGPDTAFFPTIFFACFAIGLGIGNAFMPLLTLAMADIPAADAGLGSGITNVSQQVSGALGLAVLSTLATTHTKALLAAHTGVDASLIGGYRIADSRSSGAVRERI